LVRCHVGPVTWLAGTASMAVVTPMMAAAVDGVCVLVFVLMIWAK
jgi:hypothetical protein